MNIQSVHLVCAVAYALTACAPATNNSPTQTVSLAPIRVILQLRTTAPAFDSAAFLQQLQEQTEAPVHYLASVSNDTHVYSFAPTPGQTYAQIVERLRSMPTVSRVSLDQKVPL